MPRRRESFGLLLAFAAASTTHVALVTWLVRVGHERPDAVRRSALRIAPAPAVVQLPTKPDETPIGEKQGVGDAIARVDSPGVTRAPDPHDFEQAWTRRRPSIPSAAAEPAVPLGPVSPSSPVVAPAVPKAPGGSVAALPPSAKPQAAAETKRPSPAVASVNTPDNRGDAGPSDLDPFAKEDGVEFTRGGIEARTGRQVKLARPRVDLRFMADATKLSGRNVSIQLRIETDETGAPREVRVVKSSGSEPIDDAVRLAMYDSWFGGKMPDSFPFGVTLWRD